MTVLRSLLLPFYPTSLLFVAFCAAVLALTGLVGPESAALRIIPAFFVLSYLLKYSYSLLDDAANGITEAPVASVEMLGPFETRPLLQLVLCAIVYKAASLVGGAAGGTILIIYGALLPASIGIVGVTGNMTDAINPVSLLRTAWALGWHYLLILACVGSFAYGLTSLHRAPIWKGVWYALAELAVLSIFSLIGGLIFIHRARLGFEPRSSPEQKAAVAERDRLRRRGLLFDEVYVSVRVSEYRRAVHALEHWFSSQNADDVAEDARAIMIQAAQWNSSRGLTAVTQCIVTLLTRSGRLDLAIDAIAATLSHLPTYALDSEDETVLLAKRAKVSGHPRLARTIVENFVNSASSAHASSAASALLRELND
jgi:hypothetical protein